MRAGHFKRRRAYFKKKYVPYNKGSKSAATMKTSVRPSTRAIYRMTTSEELPTVSTTADIQIGDDSMILRPRQLKKTDNFRDTFKGARVIDNEKLMDMMNGLYRDHSKAACEEPKLCISKNEKWGLGWKYAFKCENCGFQSRIFKLYQEVRSNLPGPNAATLNLGLQAGLMDCPIGNTRMRMLLTSMNIPPPAKSAMEKTAKKVGECVIQTNRRDMQSKTTLLVETLKELGLSGDIHGAFDGRYNSIGIVSHKKPGQNASQAIGVFAETHTTSHWIIDYSVENKLCATGTHLRKHGFNVQCPGHDDCTATISDVTPHSEYEMAKEIAQRLQSKGVRLKVITTDGDSAAQNAFEDVYRTLLPGYTVIKQKDPIHIGRSQVRKGIEANFSANMFPGARTKEAIRHKKTTFSRDVKARCSLVYNKLLEKSCGNLQRLTPAINRALEATIACYSGDCTNCRRHSLVCGGGQKNSWWERSAFLASSNINSLQMTENDKELLRQLIKMRLSAEAISDTRFGYNTQQCESFNFALSKSAPKNTNFPRNFEARCASAILRYNNGQGEALKSKLLSLGVKLAPSALRALEKIGQDMRAHRRHNATEKKKSIMRQHGDQEFRHRRYRASRAHRMSDYRQGPSDHPYASTSAASAED